MAEEMYNSAEKYLIKYWESAALLEATLEKVRTKHMSFLQQRVVEAIKQEHEELAAGRVKPRWFAVGKKEWIVGDRLAGFYFENIRIDDLLSEDSGKPYSYVWIAPLKDRHGVDLESAKKKLQTAVEKVVSKHEVPLFRPYDKDDGTALIMTFTQQKAELVSALLENGGQQFIDICLTHMRLWSKFVPLIDSINAGAK